MDEEVKNIVETETEAQEYQEFLRKAMGEERGMDNFFLEVVRTKDTTKVGNLNIDELGTPRLPVRTLLELKRDCALIPSMSSFQDEFEETAEDILATSLSKDGFLINSRITQKKSLVGNDKRKEKRKGLFGKKEEEE